jgi:regulator of replication initiation timing
VTSKVRCIKREQKIDDAEIIKVQGLLEKDRGSLSSNRAKYIETCHNNIDILTEANKSLNMETKKLRRKLQDDQMAKFPQDKNMLEMQL